MGPDRSEVRTLKASEGDVLMREKVVGDEALKPRKLL
jgi:hypothetical protein